ncbi:MAG: sulfur oxidation c-type cytochrome SoxA [Gammaproteobacteria bacterium]|nr:sulfur oxidation c-type cytochrome SoxA [Gammaproteobacteria bacterium]MBU1601370.1 sulfur oxidation c-type cytochrome SoxA [Gammaproteobacteria bacterium]MBU2433565.1 sulfur oxidation c-type cytochrome SoxA [Gammaproteobacteria bacterium]MBU2449898.1 sulfur oxidation c-type cytochrome SoxA [Gammaproteobacteria bacterium]
MRNRTAQFVMAAGMIALNVTTWSPSALADAATDEIAKYREMLADGNPSELVAAQGEELWKVKRGTKNATLEQCDLGLGPGVIKGASAQLPRYFKDTGRVQDLETRLMTCMETLQGIDTKELNKTKWGKGEMEKMEALVAYVVTESNGHKINVDMRPAQMKKMYELGKMAFFYRGGAMDFSCATCHGQPDKRIRLQDLPDLREHKGAAAGWGSWPAYRVSNGQFWTMQHRLNDCYRQQRFPEPIYGSDVTIALSVYLAANGNGGPVLTPGLKR